MGWLKRVRAGLAAAEKASELAQEVQTCHERVADLAADVLALTEAYEAAKADADQLRLDWATTIDKIGRWASRQSARERKATNDKLEGLATGDVGNGTEAPVQAMTKPQLRALAARQRAGTP